MAKVNLLHTLENEIKTNLSQLLMVEIESVEGKNIDSSELESSKFITVYVKFSFSTFISHLYFYFNTPLSTLVEYLMLGAMSEQKGEIDDEILDAIKEVVSTITGATATTLNTTAKSELGAVKFEIDSVSIVDNSDFEPNSKLLGFNFNLNSQDHSIVLKYDEIFERFLGDEEESTNEVESTESNSKDESDKDASDKTPQNNCSENGLSLSKEAVENLKLLFDIELKVSVRLGRKKLLLRDIVKMDIGHIIELDQLVNEPLDILLNGVKIAEGSAVVVDGKFGVLIKQIGSKRDRINQIQLG
jgi:flagellar motor switch protein FliN/FliY